MAQVALDFGSANLIGVLRTDYASGLAERTQHFRRAVIAQNDPGVLILIEPMTPLICESMHAGSAELWPFVCESYLLQVVCEVDPLIKALLGSDECQSFAANPVAGMSIDGGASLHVIHVAMLMTGPEQAAAWRDRINNRTH